MTAAVLAGASGLVGGELLRCLIAEDAWEPILLFVRRELPAADGRVSQKVVDFSRLLPSEIPSGSDVFCALGTTIRKAGSRAAFRAVDFDAVVNLARAAAGAGARHLLVVSSIGADARSRTFYTRVKGEMEEAISRLPIPGVSIFRPSFLSGERKEGRPMERLAIGVGELLGALPLAAIRKYRPIPAATVARAMARAAREGPKGVKVYESSRIHELGA